MDGSAPDGALSLFFTYEFEVSLMAIKKARVLREVELNGQLCKPNSVVLLDEKVIAGCVQDGSVDPGPAAVEYCEKELGAKAARPGKSAEAEAPSG